MLGLTIKIAILGLNLLFLADGLPLSPWIAPRTVGQIVI
jgi:hypothetical protein